MFKLTGKEINAILGGQIILIWPYAVFMGTSIGLKRVKSSVFARETVSWSLELNHIEVDCRQ